MSSSGVISAVQNRHQSKRENPEGSFISILLYSIFYTSVMTLFWEHMLNVRKLGSRPGRGPYLNEEDIYYLFLAYPFFNYSFMPTDNGV